MGQCAAKTKDGSPCDIPTHEGQKFCHIHRRQKLRFRLASASAIGLAALTIIGLIADITGILDFIGAIAHPSQTLNISDVTITPALTITPEPTKTPIPPILKLAETIVNNTGIAGYTCGYGKRHSIVRDENNGLHLFYRPIEDENALIEAVSLDGGKTWEDVYGVGIDAPTGIGGVGCSAALGKSNTIHAVFGLAASDAFYMQKPANGNWTEPLVRGQGDPDVGVFSPELATSLDGSVHLVWSSKRLWYSFFNGKSWVHETIASPGGWHPDLSVDNNGIRHLIFNDAGFLPTPTAGENTPSTVEVRYTFSKDGITWSNPIVVNTSDDLWTGDATINVDVNGRRHVTFIRDADLEGDLYYTYSDDGDAWTRPLKLNDNSSVPTGITGNESAATLLDPFGNFYTVWQGIGTDGEWYIYLRWLSVPEHKWSEPIVIAHIESGKSLGLGSNPSLPHVTLIQSDNEILLDAVWTQSDGIYYAMVRFIVE